MKKLILIILLLVVHFELVAQQDPQYTQYMYNMNVINPAYAGSRDALSVNLLLRRQWVGLDGAPETGTLSIHSPLKNERLGLGASIIYDEIGPVKETNAYVDFSYTIDVSLKGKFAMGLKAGMTFQDIIVSRITTNTQDAIFDGLEDLNKTYPNIGVGAMYYTDKFYAGLSVPNMLESRHFEKENGIVTNATEKMHFFGTMGYVFELSERLKLKPSTMVKAVSGAPVSIDLSLNALFIDKFEIGASYRLDDSISGILGFNVSDKFRIGYAYDYTLSNLGDYNSGSHEIMLLFDFHTKKYKSPRFF